MRYLVLSWTLTPLLGLLVFLLAFWWFRRHKSKYPPCPLRPWPIVGHLFILERNPREQFVKYRKKCGDVFSLYMGTTHVVILNGYDVIKEAFVKRGEEFNQKPVVFMDVALDAVNKGIASSNGCVWRDNRNTTLKIFKTLGVGKSILMESIQEEVNHFVALLDSFQGAPRNIRLDTMVSVSNVMCSLIIGRRFDYQDQQFKRMLQLLSYNFVEMTGTNIFNFFPILRFLPGDAFSMKTVLKNFREFLNVFSHVHFKANENVTGEAQNFIAAYLQDMRRKLEKGEECYLDKENLLRCIFDLFAAGTESSVNTISWFLLYMINFSEVQERCFTEIEDVIGLERVPDIQDKPKMVYLNATIMEIQRVANIAPVSGPRILTQDTEFRGYTIPKGAFVMVNYDSVLMDEAVWGPDSETFRPERFLNEDGTLNCPEEWIPFSCGRRVCPGENLAKMELFLFVANILQKFRLLPADPDNVPLLKDVIGLTRMPVDYEVRMVRRLQSV